MKWSDEKIKRLKNLCFEGKSNKEIAEALEAPVSEIYAKRSQLGITIDKVKAQKGMRVNAEFESAVKSMEDLNKKAKFIKKLEPVLQMADKNIKNLLLSDGGTIVLIEYKNDFVRGVNIECDSYLAIILDVVKGCM